MKLVIAEKPQLGRDIARAVCGAPDGARLPWRGNGWEVVACRGHLVGLAEPAEVEPERWGKPWREETLPVLPEPWPLAVQPGKEAAAEAVERGLSSCEAVYHAGDPDDEGQMIVDELLSFYGYEGPVLRVLVNDNIDANIRRAFERAEGNAAHMGSGRAAQARSIADAAFGFTESRLATLRAGHGKVIALGRVKTPTLGLVVRRDAEIAGHVAQTYYTVTARVALDGGEPVRFALEPTERLLDEDGRISDREAASRLRAACQAASGEARAKVEGRRTPPPLPYNLTELTADMSRRHKMGAQRVMDATQALRDDHRAITYNRTDCPYLPTEAFSAAPATMARAMANIGREWDLSFASMPRCFDDSKIDAHTGIIPQDTEVDVSRLAPDQRLVYEAIVERYAMQFAGDELSEVSETRLALRCGVLTHKARRVTAPGWRAILDDGSGSKGFDEGWVDAGPHAARAASAEAEEKKTKPRAPYTEGTLVKDMANAAKYVADPELKAALKRKDEGKPGEHGSIGTTATRAKTIEELKALGYIAEEKGRLRSTELGRALIAACPADISGVETTARWWLIQEKVAAGDLDAYAVARDVARVFEGHREAAWRGAELPLGREAAAKVVGRCPVCGADVVDRGAERKTFACSSNKWEKGEGGEWSRTAGCGFALMKVQAGHRLTEAQARALLEKGRTGVVGGLKSKSGKTFSARLKLTDKTRETGWAELDFEGVPKAGGKAGGPAKAPRRRG